ncbi:unnamed protein product [Polarella glacialis]|uniref:Uncharacterized protein n=1 Tax=Polarella glacialis TaxID=89957 RepID=A0A813L1N6_POLGL|nr:unnamed protein product [Polarella glacialis]
MGRLLRRALLPALAVLIAACGYSVESAQLLEFVGQDDERDVLEVSPERPAPLCLRTFERPPMWLWPVSKVRLRMQLDSDGYESSTAGLKLQIRTGEPRFLCHWLGPIAVGSCRDCRGKCAEVARDIVGSRDVAVYLPPQGGCVYVSKLPEGCKRIRVFWEVYWDPAVAFYIAGGLILVWAWRPLRENVALHAGIGGVGSLVFIALMVVVWFAKGIRGTVHGTVPFGRSLTTLGTLLFAMVPAARDAILGYAIGWLEPATDWRGWLSLRDPFFQLPIGWLAVTIAVFASLSLIMLGANLSRRYFAQAPDPEGDVPFIIGGDGRRIDLLPPIPASQILLGWCFWLLGCLMLVSSTHVDSFSVALLVAALLKDHIIHLVVSWRRALASDVKGPGDLRPLMSGEAFREQALSHTQRAVAALQNHVRANPHIVRSVCEQSELRLRRFSDGGAHAQMPAEALGDEGSSWCSVM